MTAITALPMKEFYNLTPGPSPAKLERGEMQRTFYAWCTNPCKLFQKPMLLLKSI